MRCLVARRGLYSIVLALALVVPACAQNPPDVFHWVDFHSSSDQSIVIWVTRALTVDKWTAIREIGVKYDAALVVTTDRATPQSLPGDDTFTVWSVSLTSHLAAPLVSGVNLRIGNWQRFADDMPEDLTALYDNCHNCSTATYFTAFYYDMARHEWAARWINGGQGVPVWNTAPPSSVVWTQVFAVMTEGGHAQLCTWNHFDYGKDKDPEDVVYRYDRDPFSGLDRSSVLSGKMAQDIELKLCRGQDNVQGLERGQDSALCRQLVNPRTERRPVTTPPGNNRGRSLP
ncbi:MAG TPA: hypothetical protein VHX20_10735 [Terracidiphilus sp.]|jgi:hypothetical protein|nr:hypothetical protein [Terracidiphilus sp.]